MTPGALTALALEAATRGEWLKAADLKGQAEDLERAAVYGRDPYNTLGRRRANPWQIPTPNNEQRAEADRLLAGAALTLELTTHE